MKLSVMVAVTSIFMLVQPGFAAVRSTGNESGKAFYWRDRCINLEVFVGDPPAFVTSNAIVVAATLAATAWNPEKTGCGDAILRVSTNPGNAHFVDYDNINTVQFRKDYWGVNHRDPKLRTAHPANAFAITTVLSEIATGRILDTDVEINAVNFKWDDLVSNSRPGEIVADLQNTLTHEFGHVLGLEHNCNDAGMNLTDLSGARASSCTGSVPVAIRDATMYPRVDRSDVLRRDLGSDDLAGLCAIYPRNNMSDRTSDITANGNRVCNGYVPGLPDGEGGCSVSHSSRKPSPLWFGLIAGLFAARRLRTRRRR